MSTAERMYDDRHDRWRGPSMRIHPAWIILLVLGFIVWWPIGLAILAFTFWSKSMGCHSGERWQRKMERMEEKMGRMRDRVERFGSHGFGPWGPPRSSGNHAFDEYRTETLKRLEDEQMEFKDFLNRLRHAKDKAEFDQFMNERDRRPEPPAAV